MFEVYILGKVRSLCPGGRFGVVYNGEGLKFISWGRFGVYVLGKVWSCL